MNVAELMNAFQQPKARYRTMPQWSWNGELSRERITEQIELFAEQGAGGVFPHARPGLISVYLSDQWFEMWGHGMREAERLGMQFHIYDEFCCPGGHAGGHVVAQKPHLVQRVLALQLVTDPAVRVEGTPVACFRWDRSGGGFSEVASSAKESATNDEPFLVLALRAGEHRPEKGGFALPDMLRRETAETFIATTHERYAERFSDEFGKTVRFVFCDEPQIYGSSDGWPFSRHLLREFRHDHHYELTERLGALCFGQHGAEQVRFDYWLTVNRLFTGNFMRMLHDWCERHDLMLTGHLMEHCWPSPRPHPDAMAAMRWMQAPGNDLLGFQFEATCPEDNGLYFLNAREVSSVAAQLGREWVVTESCGGAGYEAAFDVFKPLEDYLLALGVNVMDPHLCHQTLSGTRKYDWPQTLSDHSPWFLHYRAHADHVARANAALSQGVERNRVLVLHPTTTGWLHYVPPPFRLGGEHDPLRELLHGHADLLLRLYGSQVDFDLGDEFIMQELGGVEDGKLHVGERLYELVVIPPCTENLLSSTVDMLGEWLEAGGVVIGGPTAAGRVDGRLSGAVDALQDRFQAQWQSAEEVDQLVAAVRERVTPRFTGCDGSPLPSALCWRRVELPGGAVLYFFCNPWAEPLETRVRLQKAHVAELDTRSGEMHRLDAECDDGHAVENLSLAPHDHVLWLCTDSVPSGIPARVKAAQRPIAELKAARCVRLADNVLTLDYCDLEADGQRFGDISVVRADQLNWPLQGFEQNPWPNAHQFERTVIDRPIPPQSGFSLTYRFEVASGLGDRALSHLRIVVERPWLYAIELNGRELDLGSARRWFDEQMAALPIGHAVCRGRNVVTLTARPFHVLCEIMPIYVVGDFGLATASRGFTVVPDVPLRQGDWTAQGMPFYHDTVRYPFQFVLTEGCEGLTVQLADWRGCAAVARLDGCTCGVAYTHKAQIMCEEYVTEGEHELSVDVVGNMRNLLGPHHAEGLPGRWTWAQGPEHMPSGADYRLQPSGLYEPPRLLVRSG